MTKVVVEAWAGKAGHLDEPSRLIWLERELPALVARARGLHDLVVRVVAGQSEATNADGENRC